MRFIRFKAAAVATGLVLALAGCGDDGDGDGGTDVADTPEFDSGTTMAEISERGTVTIGTKFDQPGFGLQNLEGIPEGFDVEVAKIIAAELGIAEDDIEWKETPSEIREQVIEDGEVDFVVATYTINDERKQRISFAGPYYVAGQMLMTLADNDDYAGPEDIKEHPDDQVCSATGSTPSENIKPYLANPDQLVLFDVYDKCANALRTGQVDVVTTDNVILAGFVGESDGEFKLVGEPFTEEPYGIGITKGDTEFCEFINQALADNEDAYTEAWEETAGQVEGTETPSLPEPDPCV